VVHRRRRVPQVHVQRREEPLLEPLADYVVPVHPGVRPAVGQVLQRLGELAASFIGWADSPFQAEVGYASLGFAAIGFLAFKNNCMVRFAAILGPTSLTTAELRVLRLLPTHLSFREIAGRLHVSTNTVKTQAQAVYRKLDASSRSQAVARGRELGLIGA